MTRSTLIALALAASASALKLHPNGNTEWCLTGAADSFYITLERCGAAEMQDWVWNQGEGTWQIEGTSSCIAPNDKLGGGEFNLQSGQPVRVDVCGGEPHQSWKPGPFDGTWDFDTTVEGTFCLDNQDGRLASGNTIQVWKCSSVNGWGPQKWTFST